ncbi:MAG: acetate/propionate family kinase, partial [Nitrosospira sp.]
MVTPAKASILAVNSGSSSIKFALFQADSLRRILEGSIERIGLSRPTLVVKGVEQRDNFSRAVTMPGRTAAMECLLDWLKERTGHEPLAAIGHRIVHG